MRGDLETDHADEQIPWMNTLIWAEDINDSHARVLKARYYGEITYIDACLGRILDAVEAREDGDNTVICFFSDHGDHLGDHHAWQKESFFEASTHVPFLVSWPVALPRDTTRAELVCLTDLFGIATGAAGETDTRDGIDVLGILTNGSPARDHVTGMYGEPGTPLFKIMIRNAHWKYIYLANGGRELLFNMRFRSARNGQCGCGASEVVKDLKRLATTACQIPGAQDALDAAGLLTRIPLSGATASQNLPV